MRNRLQVSRRWPGGSAHTRLMMTVVRFRSHVAMRALQTGVVRNRLEVIGSNVHGRLEGLADVVVVIGHIYVKATVAPLVLMDEADNMGNLMMENRR